VDAGPGKIQLLVSASASRSSPASLDGAVVSGDLYVFVPALTGVKQVRFWLDDPTPASPTSSPARDETMAPFDFNGTAADGSATPYSAGKLTAGGHTIAAQPTMESGAVGAVVVASFTVKQVSGLELGAPDLGPTVDGGSGFVPAGYKLVFGEECSGATIDLAKWELLVPGYSTGYGGELECYQKEGVLVGNGVCTLRATKAATTCGGSSTWISGALTALTAFKHGYFEARIRLPKGKGLWPAFWLTSYPTAWATEWDIFEVPFPDNSVYGFVHLWDKKGTATFVGGAAGSDSTYTLAEGAPNLYSGYVTYGLLWTVTQLRYYVNGVLTEDWALSGTTDMPMWLSLNLAIGGAWAGAPDATTPSPSEMLIDYVRIYQ